MVAARKAMPSLSPVWSRIGNNRHQWLWGRSQNGKSPRSISSSASCASKSGRPVLVSPTEADARELFQRMNSRPDSIISQDSSRLAKYNQDWTVSLFVVFVLVAIIKFSLISLLAPCETETVPGNFVYSCSTRIDRRSFQGSGIL